jgi:hypothetical protein
MKRDKENILYPQVDLQPVIRAYRFLLRQLSMLLPFSHPLPVFPLLFWDNTAVELMPSATRGLFSAKDDRCGLQVQVELPKTSSATKPSLIGSSRYAPRRGAPWTPVKLLINMHSMRFLTTYARDNFPGFDSSPTSLPALQPEQEQPGMDSHSHQYLREERYPTGDFKGKWNGLPLPIPVMGINKRHTIKIKESGTVQGQQNLFVPVRNRSSMGSKESGVIKTFKNVRFVNRLVQEAQNQRQKQKQQTWPVLRMPFSLNVHSREKNSPGSTIINENKQEYGIGSTPLHAVNRSLGFLNEVVQPTVVQVRLEEETKAISHPAAEKVHVDRVDRVDHVNHVNYVKFLQDKVSRSAAEFTSIREIQEKADSQNTFHTSVEQAIPYVPMPAKHFLETRRVDSAAGASGMFVRMRTYNIAPSLNSLAFAGNYLHTRLMPSMSWNSNSGNVLLGADPRPFQRVLSGEKPTARRAIKSFSGDPQLPVSSIHHSKFIIQNSSFINAPLAAGGNNEIDVTLENSVVNRKEHQGHEEEFFYKPSVSSVSSVVKNFLSQRDHHYHYENAGITPQLRAAEELHRHVHEYGPELSTAVIVEKIYKTQFTNGSRGIDANLNFRESRDNQNQEVSNTFNVTMNVDKALSEVWNGDDLQDLGEKLSEILRDEARRYGIKI